MDDKKHLREISIDILDSIKRLLIFYEMDINYAKKWKKIQNKHGLRRWLFLISTYDLYTGEPPTVSECYRKYKNLLSPYFSALNIKYYDIDVINELLDLLCRKKVYTIDEAVALYEKKKKSCKPNTKS